MAETAKILNPSKTVLLPDLDAGCSLSESCPADHLARYREENPDLYVVAYVNCSAAVKGLSDVICTSGNAVNIVNRVPQDREILFVPDQNLGQWVMGQTGRKMRLWPGSCYAHVLFTQESIERCRLEYPDAPVVAHPECIQSVRDLADGEVPEDDDAAADKYEGSTAIMVIDEEEHLTAWERMQRRLSDAPIIQGEF